MLARQLHALRSPLFCADECIRPRVCRSASRFRPAHSALYVTISDPPNPRAHSAISLAHPRDPSNQPGPSQSSTSPPSPPPNPLSSPNSPHTMEGSPSNDASGVEDTTTAQSASDPSVPARYVHPPFDPDFPLPQAPPSPLPHITPPFNTHKFFGVLEKSFPIPIARNLMRVTRALLIDRIGRVKRDALTTQDLESQAYLFRAALSELRTETSVLTRNETAAMRAATTALRREVDTLGTRMKEDITTLKHEVQMDLDSRKNEAKAELKRIDMQIEEVLSRALITIGELKTQVEESRWEKLKAAVGALGVLSLVLIISMEIYVVQPKHKPPAPPPDHDVLPPSSGGVPWTA
ncbi:hypothetical protein C8Q74DRAFT_1267541 [Fomes fomentarius]|nr:hypothetical protein C8Q74DRAFT_1267541 [Fomes fomentarius]